MKKWLIAAAAIPVIAFVVTGFSNDSMVGKAASEVYGILMCLPFLALVWAVMRFHRWHRGFHARMKLGIRRPVA